MTITSQTTRQGKVIHLLSPGDLVDVVESGQRLRAYCPIHGGDHQRSLSIDSSTGWGYCHCCHATVLVKTIGSSFVSRRNDSQGWHGCGGDAFAPSPDADHRSSSLRPSLLQTRPATTLPHWQRDEVAALMAEGLSGARCSGGNQVWTRTRTRPCSNSPALPDAGLKATRQGGSSLTHQDGSPSGLSWSK